MTRLRAPYALAMVVLLAACARQIPAAVAAGAPGILRGLWDGFIFPWAWVASLFVPEVSIYAVPNNGGWYDFGYFLGVVVFGVGARKTRIVYRTARTRRRGVVGARVIRDDEG
ncbi:MAG TPA: hypothetical protein VGO55_07945 [Allosphingosinicella sp.]|jgi:hypothetical protein|nr:hypothetical protein [Allosphingosinicella sp.]